MSTAENSGGEDRRHDVFVSYASTDKAVADAIVSRLEQRNIRCWYAPRDIVAGLSYGAAIMDAIREARVFVLVLSESSNHSAQVTNEVERAVHHHLHILPFRIEPVTPSGDLEYFVSRRHWLDALPPPAHGHIDRLAEMVASVLEHSSGDAPIVAQTHRQTGRRTGKLILIATIMALLIVGFLIGRMALAPSSSDESVATAGQDTATETTHRPMPPSGGAPPPQTDRESGQQINDIEDDDADESDEAGPQSEQITPAPPPEEVQSDDTPEIVGTQAPDAFRTIEGTLGDGEDMTAEHHYLVPEDGRLNITIVNLAPRGTSLSRLTDVSVDGQSLRDIGANVTRSSDYFAVRGGQTISVRFSVQPEHSTHYRVETSFQSLAELGLAIPEESGELTDSALGSLGFADKLIGQWVYRAPDDGRVEMTVTNRMPSRTAGAGISGFSVDEWKSRSIAAGSSRSSDFITVRRGQEVNIQVSTQAGNNVVYQVDARFESLADLGLGTPEESGELTDSAKGRLGFGENFTGKWVYRAPDDGRFEITVSNLMPSRTAGAGISGFSVDDWNSRSIAADSSRSSDFLTVRRGQEVRIRVSAQAGNNVVYQVDARFESLAELGLGIAEEGGELADSAMGRLGFGVGLANEWVYRAPADGRVTITVNNRMPARTEFARITGFSIGDWSSRSINADSSRSSNAVAVQRGQEVRIRVSTEPRHNVIYQIEAKFEAD